MPRKMDLYWFIPALVNRSVGSESGTTEEDGTAQRISLDRFVLRIAKVHTKRVAILLEVIQERVSHANRGPLLVPSMCRHFGGAVRTRSLRGESNMSERRRIMANIWQSIHINPCPVMSQNMPGQNTILPPPPHYSHE